MLFRSMDVNVPGIGVWPEHRMILHLWTDAPFLPAGERYGVLVTLLQVDETGATVATIGQHTDESDPYYTGDISQQSVQHSVLEIDVPQMIGTGLRLAVLLQAWTSSADPVLVEMYIGGGWASCIETSLTSANGMGDERAVTLSSPDGSIDIFGDGHPYDIEVEFGTGIPLPDGVGSAGRSTNRRASEEKHVHPLVPPASVGGKLYAAVVPSPVQHADVDCVYSGGWSGWAQIAKIGRASCRERV